MGLLQETCSFGRRKKFEQVGSDIALLVALEEHCDDGYSWFIAAVFCDALFHINASKHVSRRNFSQYTPLKNFMLPSLWHVILDFLVGETCPLEALSFLCGARLEYVSPYWLRYCLESSVHIITVGQYRFLDLLVMHLLFVLGMPF